MSILGLAASSTMFICTMIVLVGHGIQGKLSFFFSRRRTFSHLLFYSFLGTPNGWVAGTPVTISVWAPPGTTFNDAMNAIL